MSDSNLPMYAEVFNEGSGDEASAVHIPSGGASSSKRRTLHAMVHKRGCASERYVSNKGPQFNMQRELPTKLGLFRTFIKYNLSEK